MLGHIELRTVGNLPQFDLKTFLIIGSLIILFVLISFAICALQVSGRESREEEKRELTAKVKEIEKEKN